MATNTQVNMNLPEEWKIQLERLARIYSVEEEENLSYHDLIRRAVKEKYELKDEPEIQKCSPL